MAVEGVLRDNQGAKTPKNIDWKQKPCVMD